MLSPQLKEAIQQTLDADRQVILFKTGVVIIHTLFVALAVICPSANISRCFAHPA